MKIVMTLLVRNEEDIIRDNIEFHLSLGVSFFIVTDNLSIDGTADILKEYEDRGLLRYFFEKKNNFDQHVWVTDMAVLAFEEYGADWVINNDADEFWWSRSGNLIDTLQKIPGKINVLEADRTNFIMVEGTDMPFFKRMVYRQVTSLNDLRQPLPSKVMHRGNAQIIVHPGNHSVSGMPEIKMKRVAIDILHFPMRSRLQFERKIRLGGAAYERNVQLAKEYGVVWRTLYSELNDTGSLRKYCNRGTYDTKRIQEEIAEGQIIEDRRLLDYLSNLPQSQDQCA